MLPLLVADIETPLCRPVLARVAVFDLDLKPPNPSLQARPWPKPSKPTGLTPLSQLRFNISARQLHSRNNKQTLGTKLNTHYPVIIRLRANTTIRVIAGQNRNSLLF